MFYEFSDQTPHGVPGSRRCFPSRAGAPAINFRAYFAKELLLGTAIGVNYILLLFISYPSLRLQAQKGVLRIGLEAFLTQEHLFA